MDSHAEIVDRLYRIEAQNNLILHATTALAQDLGRLSAQLFDRLDRLTRIGGRLMALADDLKASVAKLDSETTAIADVVSSLAARIKNSMTDAEVAELQGAFTALDERLKGLGVDPTNPVPPPTPAFTAAKKLAGKP